MTRVVGILGGIGSGKSEVARLLQARGAVVVSADAVGHEALKVPELKARIVKRWGTGLLDEAGDIVRRKLGAIVFADPEERKALEEIVHPWIEHRLEEELTRLCLRTEVPLVVLDAAIMIETGWDRLCDELVFVDMPRALRLERIRLQRGWSEEEVDARERAQMPPEEKARRATHVVDNAGSRDELARRLEPLMRRWGLPPAGGLG